MKVQVDATKCSAYGVCAELCPSVFQLDEWGYAQTVGDGSVPAEHEEAARKAVSSCPENAISAAE
jgi:ferredoxin